MKTQPFRKGNLTQPAVIIFVAALLMGACSGQPTSELPAPQVTDQPATAAIPITGLASATPPGATSTRPSPQAATPTAPPLSSATPALACQSPASLTPAVTEGPYFKANSPERASLIEASTTGLPLTLTGYVLTADCKPVAGALLDFWQANAQGQYDNAGYMLRGHQFTDAAGRYHLETIVPGLYPGRTEHIHVKVQAPNGPLVTTQLFFPGAADNASDQIFDPALLIQIQASGSRMQATYDFVVGSR